MAYEHVRGCFTKSWGPERRASARMLVGQCVGTPHLVSRGSTTVLVSTVVDVLLWSPVIVTLLVGGDRIDSASLLSC